MGKSSRKNRKEVAWVPFRNFGGVTGARDAAGEVGGTRSDAWGGTARGDT